MLPSLQLEGWAVQADRIAAMVVATIPVPMEVILPVQFLFRQEVRSVLRLPAMEETVPQMLVVGAVVPEDPVIIPGATAVTQVQLVHQELAAAVAELPESSTTVRWFFWLVAAAAVAVAVIQQVPVLQVQPAREEAAAQMVLPDPVQAAATAAAVAAAAADGRVVQAEVCIR